MPGFFDQFGITGGTPMQGLPGQPGMELPPQGGAPANPFANFFRGGGPPPPGGYAATPNFDARRLNNPTDNDPKTQYGRWLNGRPASPDLMQQFVAEQNAKNPGTWELSPDGSSFRVTQGALNDRNSGVYKPGTSMWQTPGFTNVAGQPGMPMRMPPPSARGPAPQIAPGGPMDGQPSGGGNLQGPNGLDINDPQAMADWRARYPAADPTQAAGPMADGGGGSQIAPGGEARAAGPMSDGAPQAAWNGPGASPWSTFGQPAPQGAPGSFAYTPINGPTPYTPAATQGPEAWNGQPVSAAQVGYRAVGPAAMQSVAPLQRGADAAGAGPVNYDRVQGPAAIQAQQINAPAPFTTTTAADMAADPGYQNRLDTSLAALQQATARNGTLRSTNTYQALMDKAGQMASDEYANVDARRLQAYNTNTGNQLDVAKTNQANAFQAYGLTNQYQQAAALANQQAGITTGTFNASQANDLSKFNAGRTDTYNLADWQAQNAANAANVGAANNFAQFNAGNQLQADTVNANAQNTASSQNAANALSAWQAYQGMRQNSNQFDATRTDTANQQNWTNTFNASQANNAGSLAAYQANIAAQQGAGQLDIARGNLVLGNRQADQSYTLGMGNLDLGRTQAANQFTLGMGGLQNDRTRIGNDFTLGQGQLALGNKQADNSYDLGLRNIDLGYYNSGNSFQLGMMGNQLGWANYGLGADAQDWNQTYQLAQLGFNGATNAGNAAGSYGTNTGSNFYNYGNAGASGTVGSANAWNQGLGGAAGDVMGGWAAYYGSQNPSRGSGQQAYYTPQQGLM